MRPAVGRIRNTNCPLMSLWIVLSYFALALFYSIFGICNSDAGGKTVLSVKGSCDVYQELILFLQTDSKLVVMTF